MKKVAIIVDDVIRDLGPLSLLSIELKKIGIEPFLVPLRIQHLEIKKIKPDVIIKGNDYSFSNVSGNKISNVILYEKKNNLSSTKFILKKNFL